MNVKRLKTGVMRADATMRTVLLLLLLALCASTNYQQDWAKLRGLVAHKLPKVDVHHDLFVLVQARLHLHLVIRQIRQVLVKVVDHHVEVVHGAVRSVKRNDIPHIFLA
jgi:hypothetical protein